VHWRRDGTFVEVQGGDQHVDSVVVAYKPDPGVRRYLKRFTNERSRHARMRHGAVL
jgi:hypothetical protein